MSTLDVAIAFAVEKHSGVKDKGGCPYILHPIHVMMEMKKDGASTEELIVAISHDVVEDNEDVTLDTYREMGFSETVIDGIDSVTKRDGEEKRDYIRRCSRNAIGRKVKMKDIKHNMDITRLKNRSELREKDLLRMAEYAWAYDYLVGGQVGI